MTDQLISQHARELQDAAEDFKIAIQTAINMPEAKVDHVSVPGNYYYAARDGLFWFEHSITYESCADFCPGHMYWGTVAGEMREFDAMQDNPDPYNTWGLRISPSLETIIDGTWVDGGIKYE